MSDLNSISLKQIHPLSIPFGSNVFELFGYRQNIGHYLLQNLTLEMDPKIQNSLDEYSKEMDKFLEEVNKKHEVEDSNQNSWIEQAIDFSPFRTTRLPYVTVFLFNDISIRGLDFESKNFSKCNLKRQGLKQLGCYKYHVKSPLVGEGKENNESENIVFRVVWKALKHDDIININNQVPFEHVTIYIEYVDRPWKLSKLELGWIKAFDLFFAKWAIEDHPRQGTNFSLPAGNYKRFIFVKYIRDKAKANYVEEKEITKRWKKYKEKQMREISIYLDKIHDYSRKDIRHNIKNSMLGKDFLIPEVELKVTATTKYKKGEKPVQRKYKRSFSNDYGL